jgi:hypothetical protein
MVRRQGKRRMQATLESGNGEKKNEGESSSSRVDALDTRERKRRRREEQRLKTHAPDLFPSYS